MLLFSPPKWSNLHCVPYSLSFRNNTRLEAQMAPPVTQNYAVMLTGGRRKHKYPD